MATLRFANEAASTASASIDWDLMVVVGEVAEDTVDTGSDVAVRDVVEALVLGTTRREARPEKTAAILSASTRSPPGVWKAFINAENNLVEMVCWTRLPSARTVASFVSAVAACCLTDESTGLGPVASKRAANVGLVESAIRFLAAIADF